MNHHLYMVEQPVKEMHLNLPNVMKIPVQLIVNGANTQIGVNAVSRAIQVYNLERELYYRQQNLAVKNVLEKL